MRSPSIVPGFSADVYLVLDEFAELGRVYREADETATDRATVVRDLIDGQYNHPIRIVAFNTAEGWSRDVTTEIAQEIQDRFDRKAEQMSGGLREFVEGELDRAKRLA
jgi:hypothetical protein